MAVDLDGTLIAGNSLHEYLKAAMTLRHPGRTLEIIALLGLRSLRLISHSRMKFTLLRHIKADDRLKTKFLRKIDALRRESVTKKIEEYKAEGARILLATAAADFYVEWLWDGPFVATETTENRELKECRGKEKLKRVREQLEPGEILEAVITDHHDDLPLLLAGAAANYLVAPSAKTEAQLEKAGVAYTTLSS